MPKPDDIWSRDFLDAFAYQLRNLEPQMFFVQQFYKERPMNNEFISNRLIPYDEIHRYSHEGLENIQREIVKEMLQSNDVINTFMKMARIEITEDNERKAKRIEVKFALAVLEKPKQYHPEKTFGKMPSNFRY